MSDKDSKKPAVAETMVGLPEVPADPGATQVGLEQVSTSPGQALATAPSLAPVTTAAALPPVENAPSETLSDAPVLPERRPSRVNVPAQAAPARRASKLSVPAAQGPVPDAAPGPTRRASRAAVPTSDWDADTDPARAERSKPAGGEWDVATDPVPGRRQAATGPAESAPALDAPTNPKIVAPPPEAAFEWTMPRVAGLAGAVAALGMAAWIFWPADTPPPPRVVAPSGPAPVREPPPRPVDAPPVEAATPPSPTPPSRPVLALDARTHVIDPYGLHAPDLPLDPAHKYRLRIERDDPKLGTVLARLDEREGWGVMRKMASHAALQFGGAKALRLHCEPGRAFTDADTFPLELVDLATKKAVEFQVFPAQHCWDREVTRTLELGDGVRHRVRVPTDTTVKLGEKVALRVAWLLESAETPRSWRAGVLAPGESLLVEGKRAHFALLDPYAGDNEGRLELELLSPDTESSGLVTPASASGAQFVPVPPKETP